MTANRSLDEFAPAEDADTDSAEPAVEPTAAEEPPSSGEQAGDDEGEEPVPPTSTYVWSPDGGPCASCGDSAEARWRDGDALVCAECKAW